MFLNLITEIIPPSLFHRKQGGGVQQRKGGVGVGLHFTKHMVLPM